MWDAAVRPCNYLCLNELIIKRLFFVFFIVFFPTCGQKEHMLQLDLNNPVIELTGDEFLPKPGVTFAQQILDYFLSQGGVAQSPWGEVLLDKKLPSLPSKMSWKKVQSSCR